MDGFGVQEILFERLILLNTISRLKLWEAVQVKNRDNTENSSSSAIRQGTTIEKWFRTYSKPSRKRATNTNWENFPEEEFVIS